MAILSEPYTVEDLEERVKGIHSRPWPRIFATLLKLTLKNRRLEDRTAKLEQRVTALERSPRLVVDNTRVLDEI